MNRIKGLKDSIQGLDKWVLIVVLALVALSVLVIYSITGVYRFNNRAGDPLAYVKNTIMFGIAGTIFMFACAFIPYKFFKKYLGPLSVLATFGLLAITLVFGRGTHSNPSAERWLRIGGFVFQPAEFARMGLVVSTAWLIQNMVRRKTYYTSKLLGGYLWILGYVGVCSFMIIRQPDMGSAIIVAGIGVIMFLCSGISKDKIFIFFGAVLGLAVIGVIVGTTVLQAYQMSRIEIWLDPFSHDFGRQHVMGFTSIASGGMFGVGLGNSMQKYGFLIEPHTDFIITLIAEELGAITVILIMAAYFFISVRCFLTAVKGRDIFSSLICIGVGSFFLIQPMVNLGGVIGLIPLSGVTLPLLSFGGTSLVSTLLMIGIYLNVRIEIMKTAPVKKSSVNRRYVSEKVIPFKQAQ